MRQLFAREKQVTNIPKDNYEKGQTLQTLHTLWCLVLRQMISEQESQNSICQSNYRTTDVSVIYTTVYVRTQQDLKHNLCIL
jgi:hypothetical protein